MIGRRTPGGRCRHAIRHDPAGATPAEAQMIRAEREQASAMLAWIAIAFCACVAIFQFVRALI